MQTNVQTQKSIGFLCASTIDHALRSSPSLSPESHDKKPGIFLCLRKAKPSQLGGVSKTFAQYCCLLLDIQLRLLEGMPDGLGDSRAGVQRAQQQESLAAK